LDAPEHRLRRTAEWQALLCVLIAHRRMVGRLCGYGLAMLCFPYTGSDIPASRGWPLSIGFTVFTAPALDEYGVCDLLPLFDDRVVRWMA
jgi:hypothetical protein